MFPAIAAPAPISFRFASATGLNFYCTGLTGEIDRTFSLEQSWTSSDIFEFNDERVRAERFLRARGFNFVHVATSSFANPAQPHTDRLIETLHAANGPPGV